MIIKVKNKTGFAQIQNTTLRDKRLSLDTRGALGEILTYSEDFKADTESLMKLFGVGREKLLKITNQLKQFGYLEIKPVRDARGKIVDKDWIFYGESQGEDFRQAVHDAENPHHGVIHDAGLPYVGKNQSTGNPHDIYINTKSSQKQEEKDLKTHTQNGTNRCVSDKSAYEAKVYDWLQEIRPSPIELPDWQKVIEFAYSAETPERRITPETIPKCYEYLKKQDWRKGRVSAQTVMNNLGEFWKSQTSEKPDWQKTVSECLKCDSRGLIKTEKGMQKCTHGKK
jgi:hypothetical protein